MPTVSRSSYDRAATGSSSCCSRSPITPLGKASLSGCQQLCRCALPAVKKGPFRAGQSYNFRGKILYEECRKPVYTPSDWDPALGARSAELPNTRLVLDFIYGYNGELSRGSSECVASCHWHGAETHVQPLVKISLI